MTSILDAPITPLTPGITPSDEQNRAIRAIIDWYENEPDSLEFFLDGEAGTGKSTTAQIALAELRDRHGDDDNRLSIAQAAYTAKAAVVMRQKGAPSASTIHRLIYRARHDDKGKLFWDRWDNGPASRADLIVVDEVSMVSDAVANDLRSYGKKILVLGDVNGQLPPIHGEGAFTRREPDFRLKELNRFAMEDPINQLAQRARQGKRLFPAFSEGQCKLEWLTPESAQAVYNPHTQVICGRHKVRWATTRNMRAKKNIHDPSPRVGEPLICCQNNYTLGILNGEFLETTYVADGGLLEMMWRREDESAEGEFAHGEPIEVSRHLFDAHYTDKKPDDPGYRKDLAWMDWGYVITCHKAQGSSWPHITVIDDSQSFKWVSPEMSRRWLYTALTRSEGGLSLLLRK